MEDVPDQPGELLVAGSIALDTVSTPSGPIEDELGGSALYFAVPASLIVPVRLVAPVGAEDEARVRKVVGQRPIDVEFLQVIDAPTYRWHAHQVEGRNVDLGSEDPIYDLWDPAVPHGYTGWAFVGSVRPDRQLQLMKRLASSTLLAGDSMISYIHMQTHHAREVVSRAAWYFCTEEEFTALGGDHPDDFRRRWWLQGLVIKQGRKGVTAYTESQKVHVPALTSHEVVDTTGAGDAFAAGMLARWLVSGAEANSLGEALAWGAACASLTIEDIGLRAIARATRGDLEARVEEVRQCMTRES